MKKMTCTGCLVLTCHLCRKLEFQTAFKQQRLFERIASIEPKAL